MLEREGTNSMTHLAGEMREIEDSPISAVSHPILVLKSTLLVESCVVNDGVVVSN